VSLPPSTYTRMPRRMPLSLGFKRYALNFDGVDDYVEVPHSDSIAPTTAFSLEAMLKIPQGAGKGKGISIVTKGIDYDYMLYKDTSQRLCFYIKDSSGNKYSTLYDVRIDDNLWHHAVGTFDGRYLRLYVDGVLRGETDTGGVSIRVTTNPLYIGTGWGSNYFQGYIAFVRFYNGHVLSGEEVRYNMLNYHSPVRDGLVLWLADRIVGNTWADESGLGNNGAIYGAQIVKVKQYELRAEVGL